MQAPPCPRPREEKLEDDYRPHRADQGEGQGEGEDLSPLDLLILGEVADQEQDGHGHAENDSHEDGEEGSPPGQLAGSNQASGHPCEEKHEADGQQEIAHARRLRDAGRSRFFSDGQHEVDCRRQIG